MSPGVCLPPLLTTPLAIRWVRVLCTAPGLLPDPVRKGSSYLPREDSSLFSLISVAWLVRSPHKYMGQ